MEKFKETFISDFYLIPNLFLSCNSEAFVLDWKQKRKVMVSYLFLYNGKLVLPGPVATGVSAATDDWLATFYGKLKYCEIYI